MGRGWRRAAGAAVLAMLAAGGDVGPVRAAGLELTLAELPARDGPTRLPLIEVSLRNDGTRERAQRVTLTAGRDFRVVVATADGRVMPESAAGKRPDPDVTPLDGDAVDPVGGGVVKYLVPGETVRETLDLSAFYDLPPGEYRVRAAVRWPTDPRDGAVQSNVLAFTVR